MCVHVRALLLVDGMRNLNHLPYGLVIFVHGRILFRS